MAKPSKLVQSLLSGNLSNATQVFDREIRTRIAEALNAKKVEVAKTLALPKKS